MSNTLVIRVLSTMLLNGKAEGPVVVTACDSYGKAYRDDWTGDADFAKVFPNQKSLVEAVSSWPELQFEGTSDSDNEFGTEIRGVSNILVEGFPVDGLMG